MKQAKLGFFFGGEAAKQKKEEDVKNTTEDNSSSQNDQMDIDVSAIDDKQQSKKRKRMSKSIGTDPESIQANIKPKKRAVRVIEEEDSEAEVTKEKEEKEEEEEEEEEEEKEKENQANTKSNERVITSINEEAVDSLSTIDKEDSEDIEAIAEEEEEEDIEESEEKESLKALTSMSISEKSETLGSTWKENDPVPYSVLAKMFEKCETTTKRLQITEYVVTLFVQVMKLSPTELLEILYLCINKLCPDYEGLELGIGESLLMKAIARSTGRNMQLLKADYVKIGDLGTVAKDSKGSQRTLFKPKPLTTNHVFKTLKEIASLTGQSSQNKKVDKIQGLLVACQENEAKYIIRQLEGKLRIGLAEQTVLSALAQAAVMSRPEYSKWNQDKKEAKLSHAINILKSAYNQLPSYDMIVPALLKYPIEELESKCTMRPGIPLKPMLAHPTKSLPEILDRFQNNKFTCEFKYDGERAQIHLCPEGKISIYSRNSENMSVRYPDIIEKVKKWLKPSTKSFILDCEAVAWDLEKSCILPFQILSTRKRKDVKENEITVQVAIYVFDCLYLNGESLLQKSLQERREILKEAFTETKDEFYFAQHMDSNDIADIQTFLDVSLQNNCEGLMVKTFEGDQATYEPSKRSRNWLKVKKDYLDGIGDSVDLVVLGAFYGRGKRTSVYGAFLLGCYDPDQEEYQTICKIGTGFSEEILQTLYDALKDHVIEQPKRFYCLGENPIKPDVWFEPVQVWEVKCADLSISPTYMAGVGQVNDSKGISLRFPRFIRIRDDKDPEEATTSSQIVEFYQNQQNNHQNA